LKIYANEISKFLQQIIDKMENIMYNWK